jgi:hypothetical protein
MCAVAAAALSIAWVLAGGISRLLIDRGHRGLALAGAPLATLGVAGLLILGMNVAVRVDVMQNGPCYLCEGPGPGLLVVLLAASLAVLGTPAVLLVTALLIRRTPVTRPPLPWRRLVLALAAFLAVLAGGAAALLVIMDVQRGALAAQLARVTPPPAVPARFVERGSLLVDLRTYAYGVALSPDDHWLAVCLPSDEGAGRTTLWLYAVDTLQRQASAPGCPYYDFIDETLRFSPDSHWLWGGHYVYSVPDLTASTPPIRNSGEALFSPDGTRLAAFNLVADDREGAVSAHVTLYELPGGRELWSASLPNPNAAASLAFERAGAVLAVRARGAFHAHLDANTGAVLDSGAGSDPDDDGPPPIPDLPVQSRVPRYQPLYMQPRAASANGEFAARAMPLSIWRWDDRAYQALGAPELAGTVVVALAFAADGRLLVVATSDGWLHFLQPE